MAMSETRLLSSDEVENVRNTARVHVFQVAIGQIARSLPEGAQDELLLVLGAMADVADKVNGEAEGPGFAEEFSHQVNLAARKLRDQVKAALERE